MAASPAGETELSERGLELHANCRVDEDITLSTGRGAQKATIPIKAGSRGKIIRVHAGKCRVRLEVAVKQNFVQQVDVQQNPLLTLINEVDISIKKLVTDNAWLVRESKRRAEEKKKSDEEKKRLQADALSRWSTLSDAQMGYVYCAHAIAFLCGLEANSIGTSANLIISKKKMVSTKITFIKGKLILFPFTTDVVVTKPEKKDYSIAYVSVLDAEPIAIYLLRPGSNGTVPFWCINAVDASPAGNMVWEERTDVLELKGPAHFANEGIVKVKIKYQVLTNAKRLEEGTELIIHNNKRRLDC